MNASPDQLVRDDDWSQLDAIEPMPDIDLTRLHEYRQARLREQMDKFDVPACVLFSPVSLRYAMNHRSYALFSAHIPCTYLFMSSTGEVALHNTFDPDIDPALIRPGRPVSNFYAGDQTVAQARKFADDMVDFLDQIGADRRVAVEYCNPSITQALEARAIEVIDGVLISENARQIKSFEELQCMRWAIKVAQYGADRVREALRPGVTELQLWGLLNYTNLANNGDWHDGRMLASGPRINPWLQEASPRVLEAGDLLGFDTDMVGPMGYCADLSRTLYCGPGQPSQTQKDLYRLAMAEIEHNLTLIKPGMNYREIQQRAFTVPEAYQQQAYPCIVHGVGMCDEYPHIQPLFRGPTDCDGELQSGMVMCVESYMGEVGQRDGVKLEQQVVVTDTGYELLTDYPFEDNLQ